MQENIRRWFKIVIGLFGAIATMVLLAEGIHDGRLPGLSRMSAAIGTGASASASAQPAQFWFLLLFWAAAGAGFAWLAWSAWRD